MECASVACPNHSQSIQTDSEGLQSVDSNGNFLSGLPQVVRSTVRVVVFSRPYDLCSTELLKLCRVNSFA